jgi:chromosome partitioning protein
MADGMVCAYLTMKGGVGKTTLAANVTRSIADLYSKSILLIDADSQCNLSQLLCKEAELDDESELTFRAAFGSHKLYSAHDLKERKYSNPDTGSSIDFVRGSFDTFQLNATATPTVRNRAEACFIDFIASARASYDLTVIDTNPSATFTTLQVLGVCDFLVSPITHDIFSMRGISQVVNEMRRVHRWLENPDRIVIVRNKIKPLNTDDDVLKFRAQEKKIREKFPDLARSLMPRHVRTSELFANEARQDGFVADQSRVRHDIKAAVVADLNEVAKFVATRSEQLKDARLHPRAPQGSQKTLWERFTESLGGLTPNQPQ